MHAAPDVGVKQHEFDEAFERIICQSGAAPTTLLQQA